VLPEMRGAGGRQEEQEEEWGQWWSRIQLLQLF
jgi:hypothetical protein